MKNHKIYARNQSRRLFSGRTLHIRLDFRRMCNGTVRKNPNSIPFKEQNLIFMTFGSLKQLPYVDSGGDLIPFTNSAHNASPTQRNANQKQKGIFILFKLNPRVTTFTTFPPKADQERVLLNFHLLFSSAPFALQLVAQLYELAVASVALVRVIVHVYSRTFYETRFIIWFPTTLCSQKHFLSDLLISEERSVLDSVCVIRHPRG